jgi:hypothetical protein
MADGGPFWLVANLWAQHQGATCDGHDDNECAWWGETVGITPDWMRYPQMYAGDPDELRGCAAKAAVAATDEEPQRGPLSGPAALLAPRPVSLDSGDE